MVRRKKIKKNDFEIAMKGADLNQKVIENIFKKYKKLIPKWSKFIEESFLSESKKEEYKSLLNRKSVQIEL